MSSSSINPATTDSNVSSDNFVTTTLGDRMTLAELTNVINSVFAIKNCFQRDFDRCIISEEHHMFLLNVAMRENIKLSTV